MSSRCVPRRECLSFPFIFNDLDMMENKGSSYLQLFTHTETVAGTKTLYLAGETCYANSEGAWKLVSYNEFRREEYFSVPPGCPVKVQVVDS
jgi:hypothetical protein